MSTKISNFSGT